MTPRFLKLMLALTLLGAVPAATGQCAEPAGWRTRQSCCCAPVESPAVSCAMACKSAMPVQALSATAPASAPTTFQPLAAWAKLNPLVPSLQLAQGTPSKYVSPYAPSKRYLLACVFRL